MLKKTLKSVKTGLDNVEKSTVILTSKFGEMFLKIFSVQRIFNLLPEDQSKKIYDLWKEFEEQQTPESKFARTMDNFQPCMLSDATDGKSWVEHQVKLSQILERNKNTAQGSLTLWEFQKENFILPNVEKGRIINDQPEK